MTDKPGHLSVAGTQRKDIVRTREANTETVRFAT